MKNKYIYLILLILIVVFVYFWINRSKKDKIKSPVANSMAIMEVKGVIASGQNFANVITLSGSTEANEQVQIRSEVTGLVRNLYFQEGTTVQSGQLLLQIDDSELQAKLNQTQTRELLSRDNERRAALLLEKEAISQQEYDVAQADFKTAQSEIQLIQTQIAKTRIKAPFSGRIGLRAISVGEYLTPNTVVANLVSINPIKISFSIPEKYSREVHTGQDITFSVAGSDRSYAASIYAIEPSVDASTRTVQVKARTQNDQGEIVPGSFARVELPIRERENAILIPTEAVIPIQNGKQVFLFKNGKAQLASIETDERTGSDIIVTSGLTVGDTVLTSGIMTLKAGMPIKVLLNQEVAE
jgi:membrane fusion protein (multidrug efflux system)